MKPNSLKSYVSVLEKESVQKEKETQPETKVQPKAEAQTQIKKEATSNFFSANTFEHVKPLPNIKKEQFQNWAIPNEKFEEQEKPDIQEDFISLEKPRAKKKQFKFKTKVLTAVYCVIVAVCVGWITTNAIRIGNLTDTMTQNQSILGTNEIKYIRKIEELENLKDQPPKIENSELIPIEEFITVNPLPLENVTDYEKQSNWFDNIVNWFGNLFGG